MSLSVQLGINANWYKLYEQTFLAARLGKAHVPIPALDIPFVLDNQILAVRVLVDDYKRTWQFGGTISQQLRLGSGGVQSALPIADGTTFSLRINRSKLLILPFPTNYQLEYNPPKWFKDFTLTIWQYRGEIQDTTEQKIDLARLKLADIEQKIDTILNS